MIPGRWLFFLFPLSLPFVAHAEVGEEVWGELEGQSVKLFTLGDAAGLEVQVMSYGVTLVSVRAPDRAGHREEIVLRLDSLDGYFGPHPLFGSTVGRFANRIDGGGFEIDGVRHELASVNPRTGVHIHGGPTGFDGIESAGGYDHCFVLRAAEDGVVARLHDPGSGRTMAVESTAPSVQFYVPAQLAPTLSYKGKTFGPKAALCLEFQHFPDSPNHPSFPSTLLRPGEEYRQVTIYRFSVR